MHYIVGIDVAKRSHEAIIMDEEGTVVQKSFLFRRFSSLRSKSSKAAKC